MLVGGLELDSGYMNLHGSWGRKTACKAEYLGEGSKRSICVHMAQCLPQVQHLCISSPLFSQLWPQHLVCAVSRLWD